MPPLPWCFFRNFSRRTSCPRGETLLYYLIIALDGPTPRRRARGKDRGMEEKREENQEESRQGSKESGEEKRLPGQDAYEWVQALVCSVLTVVMIFTFAVRLIGVDGHSMVPTLQHADRLVVLSPILYHDYKAGDIVVLRKESFSMMGVRIAPPTTVMMMGVIISWLRMPMLNARFATIKATSPRQDMPTPT